MITENELRILASMYWKYPWDDFFARTSASPTLADIVDRIEKAGFNAKSFVIGIPIAADGTKVQPDYDRFVTQYAAAVAGPDVPKEAAAVTVQATDNIVDQIRAGLVGNDPQSISDAVDKEVNRVVAFAEQIKTGATAAPAASIKAAAPAAIVAAPVSAVQQPPAASALPWYKTNMLYWVLGGSAAGILLLAMARR